MIEGVFSFLSGLILISNRKYCRLNGLERNLSFLFIGFISLVISGLADVSIYIAGFRRISGYGTFSRVGFYIFFLSMGIETARNRLQRSLMSSSIKP